MARSVLFNYHFDDILPIKYATEWLTNCFRTTFGSPCARGCPGQSHYWHVSLVSYVRESLPWSRWNSKLTRKNDYDVHSPYKSRYPPLSKKKRNKILNPTKSVCERPIVTYREQHLLRPTQAALASLAQLWNRCARNQTSTSNPPQEAAIAHQNAPRRTVSPRPYRHHCVR